MTEQDERRLLAIIGALRALHRLQSETVAEGVEIEAIASIAGYHPDDATRQALAYLVDHGHEGQAVELVEGAECVRYRLAVTDAG